MNATHIATLPGLTTFQNATSTNRHLFLREGSYYLVEANCRETIENLTPLKVEKLEARDVVLTGKLKSFLEGHFLE